ncbi:MAG: hypothetical protein Q8K86_11535 [Candidatus Nanopelagicaceae bacterium]|nr:hypothetical protein [Candidatus Nanopelagicaceae bacterium]
MAALIPTYQIKNETEQKLTIKVDENLTSTIFPSKGSTVSIQSKKYVEVEQSRTDQEQLDNMRRRRMISVVSLVRSLVLPTPGGSSGSGTE